MDKPALTITKHVLAVFCIGTWTHISSFTVFSFNFAIYLLALYDLCWCGVLYDIVLVTQPKSLL